MTDAELCELWDARNGASPPFVRVSGGDYTYEGWLIMIGHKKRGGLRCVVEHAGDGRLFIHNAGQINRADLTDADTAQRTVWAIVHLLPNDREVGLGILDAARRIVDRFKR